MDPELGYYLYAGLYRLAVIAAGIVCVVLGYRLFLKGVDGTGDGNGTSAEAGTGNFKLSIKNAAPGTCFALFGAALIVAMVVQAQPSLSIDTISAGEPDSGNETELAAAKQGDSGTVHRSVRIKGGVPDRLWTQARKQAEALDFSAAIESYGAIAARDDATAADIARVASGMARLYVKDGRNLEALAMARLAVQVDGENPDFLRTLAVVALANGLKDEADAAMNAAGR